MAHQLIEDALGDVRNAKALAEASDLAYLPEAEGTSKLRAALGVDTRLVSVDNTQAYVGGNDEHIVAVFRGSEAPTSIEGLKDWLLTDAVNLLIVPEGQIGTDFIAAGVGARFHQGFMGALAEVWGPFSAAVQEEMKKKERPLWVAGHSLGGALAQLAAWRLRRQFVNVHQVYTYGAPMVGNVAATEAFDRELAGKIYRYVNTADLVPKLPTVSVVANTYGHCQKEMLLGTSADAASDFLKGMVAHAVEGLVTGKLINMIWDAVKQRIGAHDIVNYREGIKS
jgi:triacylglycerol lipase